MRLGGGDVNVSPATRLAEIYGRAEWVRLRFRHRYEVNPEYIDRLERGGMVFSGRSRDGEMMQVLELPAERHPFFIGTQAHAELTSRPLRPEPMFLAFVRAAGAKAGHAVSSD